ncbi:MAG: hypothetical protein V3W41_05560 [Planctomycetota bacterium]
MATDRITKSLVSAALEFRRRRLWFDVDSEAAISLKIPDESEVQIATLMGRSGMEFGINVHDGPLGLDTLRRVLRGESLEGTSLEQSLSFMGFSFQNLCLLAPDDRRILDAAGLNARREASVPVFIQMTPGHAARVPKRRDQKRLLWIINAVLEADEQGCLKPMKCTEDKLLHFDLGGTAFKPTVRARIIKAPSASGTPDLAHPLHIKDPDSWEKEESSFEKLIKIIDAENQEIPTTPKAALPSFPLGFSDWQEVGISVCELLGLEIARLGRNNQRAQKRFFGCTIDEITFPGGDAAKDVIWFTLFEWVGRYYRPTKRSRTVEEKLLLSKKPDPAQRQLLEARAHSHASMFRVQEIDAGRSLTLTNLLDGESTVLNDVAMSLSAAAGACFVAGLYSIGGFTLAINLGPAIPPMAAEDAIGFLEEQGVVFGDSYIESGFDELGRLWPWLSEYLQSPPEYRTSEGHEVVPVDAWYKILDYRALISAFDADPYIDHNTNGDNYALLTHRIDAGPDSLGLLRALFEILGDELSIHCKSLENMNETCRWLDGLGCVKYLSKKVLHQEPASPDDALPSLEHDAPIDPEAIKAITEFLQKTQKEWLDEPSPSLDGLSPREAAKTNEHYRRKVRRLILTLPDFPGPSAQIIHTDHAALLKEIGLES